MRVLIVRNNANAQAIDASVMLCAYLSSQGIDNVMLNSSDLGFDSTWQVAAQSAEGALDMAVVLGGDGTILHTARLLEGRDTPILGINFGHMGFLANEAGEGVVSLVSRALADELKVDRRTNLHIEVVCDGEFDPYSSVDDGGDGEGDDDVTSSVADGMDDYQQEVVEVTEKFQLESNTFGVRGDGMRGARQFFALNEIAVTRGALGRIINFSLDISDTPLCTLRGDGVVVATATGSTAYALSAGGPLVAPEFRGLITVPIAPHTLHARTILASENDVVCITLDDKGGSREATLFVDGDMLVFDKPVKRVYVQRGQTPTLLLRAESESFFKLAAKTFY